jgi:tetratricopeptide (TPR) repeat protein
MQGKMSSLHTEGKKEIMGKPNARKIILLAVFIWALDLRLPARRNPGLDQLLQQGNVTGAEALCSKLHGLDAAWGWPLLGDHYLQAGCLQAALDCYQKGIPVVGLARTWSRLAELSLKRGETGPAREKYGRALRVYQTLIGDDRCRWDPAWNDERLEVRMAWRKLGGDDSSDEAREKLLLLLDRAAAYCNRLEEAVLHYICEEEVIETVDRSHPLTKALLGPESVSIAWTGRGSLQQTRTLYDYMLIGTSGSISEKRYLLLKSGKPSGVEKSDLLVSHYLMSRMVYYPIALFASGHSRSYEYRLLEERDDPSGHLTVVEILPFRFPAPPLPFGKAWLRNDGRVERIELNLKSIENYDTITRTARDHDRVPAISFVITLGMIRDGLGFPSAIHLRDAFLDENGKESLASDVEITYGQYRFYKVESRESVQEY